MAVDIIITLTTAGTDQGSLFKLYSNIDGFNVPYEANIPYSTLSSGYTTSAPDGTTTVRVCGQDNICSNCVDIFPVYTTTTTTSLPIIECNEEANSGGAGITEYVIPLETNGGILVLDFNAYGVPDKLEILHSGVKVATSGMTVNNGGPFDDVFGDPDIPNIYSEVSAIDQFIGTMKNVPPTRETEIENETGIAFVSSKQQLIWFEYSAADVLLESSVVVRITGPSGTAWSFTRLCPPTTTTTTTIQVEITTTTTTSVPTTTTTTTIIGLEPGFISLITDTTDSCGETLDTQIGVDIQTPNVITAGDIVYSDVYGAPFVGNGDYYNLKLDAVATEYSARINASGEILAPVNIC